MASSPNQSLPFAGAKSRRNLVSRRCNDVSPPTLAGTRLAAVARPAAAVFDQAIVSGTSFLAAVLIGRWAGDTQLGLYSLGITIVVLACGVQESLVLIPYTVLAARKAEDRSREFATSSLLQSSLTSFVIMVFIAVGSAILWWSGLALFSAPLAAVLIGVVPMVLLRELARRFAFAHIKLRQAVVIDIAVAGLQLTLLAWLAFSGRLSASAGLGMLALACATVGAAWLITCRRQFSLAPRTLADDWRQTWSLGRWFLAGHVTGIIQAYTVHWILAILLGAAATGEFAAVATIVSLANPLIIGVGNFLMPATAHTFANTGVAGVWLLALRSTRWLASILAVFCVAIAILGDWAITFIYGQPFSGQGMALTILAVATSVAALGVSAEHGLRALDRPRAVFFANLLALIVTLVLAACLIPGHGTSGAAIAVLSGNVVGCLVRWWAFRFSILDFGFSIESKIQYPISKIGGSGETLP